MRQKPGNKRSHGEKVVKDIRSVTRKQCSAEEKIRIVLDGLKGGDSIAELRRREGIAQSLYYSWSKEFLEAGKKRLAGDTARAATSSEVKDLRRESRDLKEVVAELFQKAGQILTLKPVPHLFFNFLLTFFPFNAHKQISSVQARAPHLFVSVCFV